MRTAKKVHGITQELVDLILSRCEPVGDCMIWTGATSKKNRAGHGRIVYKGRAIGAHRAVWAKVMGEIPDGMVICHKCDVPLCCNVDHMFMSTQLENVRDMIEKKRDKKRALKGEESPNAKLTEEDVRYIKSVYIPYDKEYGCTPLAKKFSIADSTISKIIKGTRWGHVN